VRELLKGLLEGIMVQGKEMRRESSWLSVVPQTIPVAAAKI